ncbi:MAG: hypothetical protein ACE5JG_10425 [Planctomycetota bacterium]
MRVSTDVTTRPAAERGVALILVLVLLPLVAILITQLSFEVVIARQLAHNLLDNQRFKSAVNARLAQMRLRLVRDLRDDEEGAQQEGAYDYYGDIWGTATGSVAPVVRKGDRETGDDITLHTEVVDEQSKFNLNLLTHNEARRAGRAREVLVNLLDFFRDERFGDYETNEWDLDPTEAAEVATGIWNLVRGQERDERIPRPKVPPPNANMKQGIYTVDDLVFAHELMREKRLLESFNDAESGQVIPSLAEFVTVYGDGRINLNTAPIQVLRAMFREPEGQKQVAEDLFHGRGGFLNTEEDAEAQEEKGEKRREYLEEGDEEGAESLEQVYKSLNDVVQGVESIRDQAFLRRNDVDMGRDFSVRSNFFRVIVTARRGSFVYQRRVVFERHSNGTVTREVEVRTADLGRIPGETGEEPEVEE